MIKLALYTTIILSFIACRSNRSLEGRVKPVYFSVEPDFVDTLHPVFTVNYPTLQDLRGAGSGELTEIRLEQNNQILIKQPTIFRFIHTRVLAYPHERISIKGSIEDPIFETANAKPRRNKELNFFKTFDKLQQYPVEKWELIDPSLDTIFAMEKMLGYRISKADSIARKIFDSLASADQLSGKFKKLAQHYIDNRYDGIVLRFYSIHQNALIAHGSYFERLRAMIPMFNAINKRVAFNHNVRQNLDDLVRMLFPENHMWSLGNEEGMKRCFDSVVNNFSGLARDYLVSRIMYRANSLGLSVPRNYRKQYRRFTSNHDYRRIVKNVKKERQRKERNPKIFPNQLIPAGSNSPITLEKILDQHQGKLILIDVWASWCLPCIQEIPHINQLVQKYSADSIVFVSISADKSTAAWRMALARYPLKTAYNYQMSEAANTTFFKQYTIQGYPRYLLIGRDGKVLNADAPPPSDAGLAQLIDKMLQEK